MKSTVIVWDFNETWIFKSDIRKISDTKRNENLFNWSRFVPWGETDGQTDMAKLTVVCSNYANVPELTCTSPSYTTCVQKMTSFLICSSNFIRNELYNLFVMSPCKVHQYSYHGGTGRDQQLLTSPMLTAQGFSFCRHQQYFNSRYCQLPL